MRNITKKSATKRLIWQLLLLVIFASSSNWLAGNPLMADTATSTTSSVASVLLTLLYGSVVVTIVFVLSSLSTLALIVGEDLRHQSAR